MGMESISTPTEDATKGAGKVSPDRTNWSPKGHAKLTGPIAYLKAASTVVLELACGLMVENIMASGKTVHVS
jgi:hypothetical protein